MKTAIMCFFFSLLLLSLTKSVAGKVMPEFYFQSTNSFFPGWKELSKEKLKFGYLSVPERWGERNGKLIKLAVVVIPAKTKIHRQDPLIFIQGGPGGGTIGGLQGWLNHPARKERDIVLLDLRGTGFSQPSLAPELGHRFAEVLAENYKPEREIQERVRLALDCEESLVKRGINIGAYNSESIAADLHALRISLGYQFWNVYGVSYGTHVALNYIHKYPDDVKSVILDSPVPPDAGYYNNNTSNYSRALNVLFAKVKNNSLSNRRFPDIENVYYSALKSLRSSPILVYVSKEIIPSGKFYFNDEDMMIAVQQALYSRKLIQVLPLMIEAFHDRNTSVLSVLIRSLTSRLSLDYGTYYCILCNEMLPFNSLERFNEDVKKNKKLGKGLTFYKAELSLCKKWNEKYNLIPHHDTIGRIDKKALIISGEFDPMTPPSNGLLAQKIFPGSYFMKISGFGHSPGSSDCGKEMITEFLENPDRKPDLGCFSEFRDMKFENDIIINHGVASIAQEINSPSLITVGSFLSAFAILLFFVVSVLVSWFKKKDSGSPVMKYLLFGSCLILFVIVGSFIVALMQAMERNFYILAFGLSDRFSFIFIMGRLLVLMTMVAMAYFLLNRKMVRGWGMSLVLITLIIINIYFIGCGFTTFWTT